MPSCRRPGGFCSEPSASTFSLQKHRTDEQSGLVRGTAQTHSRASHTSELLRSRHLAQLQRRVEKSIQGQITCFSRTASDAVEDRAQLLPSQAWGEGFPLLLCPVPRSSQAPGKWMDRSSLNFSFHLSQRMGRRMGLTGVPQGAPVCGAKPRPCTNRLHPGLWISGWEDYEGSGTRQPPDSPFPSLEARLQNQVAASPRMLGLLLTYLLEPVGSKREAAADRIATELALHLGLNPQSHQRPLSSANSRDDTQKNATSF